MHKPLKVLALLFVAVAAAGPVSADGDAAAAQALADRIRALEARVAALEAQRSFTSFMPDFAERFHVMHRAGEAGDWALASHELEEMKRMSDLAIGIDTKKGELMEGMMRPNFVALEAAITHGDADRFERALVTTVDSCNACHVATGSDFIEVRLDAGKSLGMRHPHVFTERGVGKVHTHGTRPLKGSVMSAPHISGRGHDDTGKLKHMH
jgi:hypothetical protein